MAEVRPPALPRWVLVVVAALVVVLLAFTDHAGARWGLANCSQQPWLGLRLALRPLGSGACQAGGILLLLLWGMTTRRRRVVVMARWLLLSFILATVVATAGKWAVRRPRPAFVDDPRPALMAQIALGEWHSFPSGDVTVASALTVLVWATSFRRRRWSWLLVIPLLVGVQRFLAARHFLTDIAGGLVLGVLVGAVLAARVRRDLALHDSRPGG